MEPAQLFKGALLRWKRQGLQPGSQPAGREVCDLANGPWKKLPDTLAGLTPSNEWGKQSQKRETRLCSTTSS
jgi:hypothetical protein